MFCPNCGAKLEEGAVFCQNCGVKIEESAAPESNTVSQGEEKAQTPAEEKKATNKNVKGIIGIVAAIVVVILVVKLLAAVFAGKPDNLITVYDSEKEETAVYLNQKLIGTVDGEADVITNMDKSAFYLMSCPEDESTYTVYYVKGSKLVEVADKCEEVVVANHAKTALLIDEDSALSMYNGSKLTEIEDEDVLSAAISGDGKYYAYNTYDDNAYIGNKPGKETKVKDVSIYYISENGKYMYGRDDEGKLVCVNKKGEKDKIGPSSASILGLNNDGTELLFTDDGKTYISVKGKEKKKICSDELDGIIQKKSDESYANGFYTADSFKKAIAYRYNDDGDYTIYKLAGNYEAEKILKNLGMICGVNEDATALIYLEDGDLCYTKIKKNAKSKELAEDVRKAWTSDDCKTTYFYNDDDELYRIKGTGKAKLVNDDIELSSAGIVIDDVLYVLDSDYEDWYYIKNKKSEVLDVEDISYDDITGNVYAYSDDAVYQVNGKKLKELKGDFDEIGYVSVN